MNLDTAAWGSLPVSKVNLAGSLARGPPPPSTAPRPRRLRELVDLARI